MKAYRAGYIPDLCADYAAETRAKAAGMAIKGIAEVGYVTTTLKGFRCIRVPERDAEAQAMAEPGWLDRPE